ncbi:helix-turn-helix domain-containing protein [Mucilaginibacter celer]|uniref:XRE family transcriptional regulator n=1 Tax=Mucilaginibacter celer TaxID=2305508 RepID=A0A494W6K2_9SPHI|nr:helix-turn-helix transcriptional regulator [Mucilaginibacter celer]AYL99145.1 XRE family transcriptional regulator [Mucilaginibacter celer]
MNEQARARAHREQFGRKIALERNYRALSLEQLAELTAIDVAMLRNIEETSIDFSIEYMFTLFEVLNIDTQDFFSDFK